METLIFYNNKGGVAKTMSCVNLACIFAEKGMRTLLIDLDPQANATHFFLKDKTKIQYTIKNLLDSRDNSVSSIDDVIYHSDDTENLWVIPAEADLDDAESSMMADAIIGTTPHPNYYLAHYLNQMNHTFDMIMIDTHPAKKRLLNINGLVAASFLLLPVDSDPESFEGMNGLLDTYKYVKTFCEGNPIVPQKELLGIIFTKFRNTAADIQAISVLSESVTRPNGEPLLFDTAIPLRTKAVESRWEKIPLIKYAPNDACAISYRKLADEILTRIGELR